MEKEKLRFTARCLSSFPSGRRCEWKLEKPVKRNEVQAARERHEENNQEHITIPSLAASRAG